MLRRKELTDQVNVMRDAQKIIKRDPDLMQVMEINIGDKEISNQNEETERKNYESEAQNTNGTQNSNSSKSKHENMFGPRK